MRDPKLWIKIGGATLRGRASANLPKTAEANFQLVEWTGEGSDPETECRVVNIKLRGDGTVEVEHSRSYGWDDDTEHITRRTFSGWEEE